MQTPFEITKEEVLELAAKKLVDESFNGCELHDSANALLKKRVEEIVADGLKTKVDEFLTREMNELLSKEIFPVDIWGDKVGKPTTVRAQLHERAKAFWDVKVNDEGREVSYGGEPRHTVLMKKILKNEFANAVKANSDVIVAAFKKALKDGTTDIVSRHIDGLIRI